MINSSLDENQRIYIDEEGRESLFNEIFEAQQKGQDIKYYFSSEYLERYCLGDTSAYDYAYSHIRALLKKEYKEWLKSKSFEKPKAKKNSFDEESFDQLMYFIKQKVKERLSSDFYRIKIDIDSNDKVTKANVKVQPLLEVEKIEFKIEIN